MEMIYYIYNHTTKIMLAGSFVAYYLTNVYFETPYQIMHVYFLGLITVL